jgi:hypothetical protein
LDLELLTVDDQGFWPELYDERYQPSVNYQLPDHALPAYGQLPGRVHYSKKVRRMLHVPPGQSVIFHPDGDRQPELEEVPAPAPGLVPIPDGGVAPLPAPPQ